EARSGIDRHAVRITIALAEARKLAPFQGSAVLVDIENVGDLPRAVVVIHQPPIRAEGGTVRDAISFVDDLPTEIGIEPVKRACRFAFIVVHRACPEAARTVDLAVIEAVAWPVGFGVHDWLEAPIGEIDEEESFISCCDESALGARNKRTDAHRRVPAVQFAIEVQPEDLPSLYVYPVERPLARHPHGPFSKYGLHIRDARDLRLVRHGVARYSRRPRKRKGERALALGMGWAETFIAVDWGTTNRRAWRIEDGKVAEEFDDDRGVLSIEKADFPPAVAEIRERLGDLPVLMAGMIGSNRGWVEAAYVPCPAGLVDVAATLGGVEASRPAVAPGLPCQDPPDVMRGEEVQILGAVEAGLVPPDALVC